MSEFSDLFASVAMPALQDVLGDQITYAPRNGSPFTVTAIINRATAPDKETLVDSDLETCRIKVARADVTAPQVGDWIDLGDGLRRSFHHIEATLSVAFVLVFTRRREITAGPNVSR